MTWHVISTVINRFQEYALSTIIDLGHVFLETFYNIVNHSDEQSYCYRYHQHDRCPEVWDVWNQWVVWRRV